jgi:hypothetical protein
MAAIRPSWILRGIAPIGESPPLTASHASSAGFENLVLAVETDLHEHLLLLYPVC